MLSVKRIEKFLVVFYLFIFCATLLIENVSSKNITLKSMNVTNNLIFFGLSAKILHNVFNVIRLLLKHVIRFKYVSLIIISIVE